MENSSAKSAIIKSVVLVVLGALIVLGVYFLFTRNKKASKEEDYVLTVVDEITTTNLEKNYPADARMVVDFYGKIMRTLYREEYTEEQQMKMLDVLAGIMDDELLAGQTSFYQSMRSEVEQRKKEDYSIVAYVVQNAEPNVVKVSGKKMCNIDCLFSLRHGTVTTASYYQFVMRQDDEGKWKILGWVVKQDE
jgi:hypothetical protein